MSIQAIAFDIGHVLVDVDVRRGVRRVAEAAGVGEAEAEFAMFGPHHRKLSRGAIGGPSFHEAVCAAMGATVAYDVFCQAWCDMFEPMQGMEPLVHALSRRYPLFLCSNTDPLHYAYLKAAQPILSYARGAVLSYDVGAEKPEPEIYEALLARTGTPAEATLFVDDREDNVAGAAALGIVAVQFESAEDLRADLVGLGVDVPA